MESTLTIPTRFCIDCKHSRETGRGRPGRPVCEAPQNYVDHVDEAKYLATGIPQPTIKAMRGGDCTGLRQNRSPEMLELVCGPEGIWFEPKPAPSAEDQSGVVGVAVVPFTVGNAESGS